MHTHKRLFIIVVLLGALLPLSGALVLTAAVTRDEAQQKLAQALEEAKDGYRAGASLDVNEQAQRRILSESERSLETLEQRKTEVRARLAAVKKQIDGLEDRSSALADAGERALRLFGVQQDHLVSFLRASQAAIAPDPMSRPGRLFFRRMTGSSMGDAIDEEMRAAALTRARRLLMVGLRQAQASTELVRGKLHASAGELGDTFSDLQTEREAILRSYDAARRKRDGAKASLELSEEQLAEVQRITAAVEADILAMQSELARIDERIRVRAERELIQKGLRTAKPDRYSQTRSAATVLFSWPVSGPVSAGFFDASYKRFFRVEHKAIDIVVPQGTTVRSASDGIVYLVRNGGARGYTYVLIGHRNGYATLYGHLSSVSVKAGDDVHAGDAIALSGGTPGTNGAGPMTTGAHLHFEVIKNGAHVDPRTVLP